MPINGHTHHNDPEAITEFCRLDPYAIMYPWVAQEMARLRELNTKEAKRHLTIIMQSYIGSTQRKADTYGSEIAGFLDEYEIIRCNDGKLLKMKGERNRFKEHRIKHGKITGKSSDTLEDESYPDIAKYRSPAKVDSPPKKLVYFTAANLELNTTILEEIRGIAKNLRFWIGIWIGKYCHDGLFCHEIADLKRQFHPILAELFIKVDQICAEIELYKKIRQEFNEQEYGGKHSLFEPRVRDITLETPLKDLLKPEMIRGRRKKPRVFEKTSEVRLGNAFDRIATKTGKAHGEPCSTYKKYRIIEAIVNNDLLIWYKADRTPKERESDKKYFHNTVERILKADGFYQVCPE